MVRFNPVPKDLDREIKDENKIKITDYLET